MKYRINLDPIRPRLEMGEVITMIAWGGVEVTLADHSLRFQGEIADNPSIWPQALLEEELDTRYILEDAPVEVSDNLCVWIRRHWHCCEMDSRLPCKVYFDGGTQFTESSIIGYKYWRIPTNMDPEEWKAKWYRPPGAEGQP